MQEQTLDSSQRADGLPTTTGPSPPGLSSLSIATPSSNDNPRDDSGCPAPAHRSHDPDNNLKRCDPFQFGSRYLLAEDDVFEFNAWDHVQIDDSHRQYTEAQYAAQRAAPVSDFDKQRFNADPAKWWNVFYKNNTANFFKNRKWLRQEFPVLASVTQAEAGPTTILEVGAGAGNTAFPILAHNENPNLRLHACDFSKRAVDLIRAHELYDERFIQADVWDVAAPSSSSENGHAPSVSLPPGLSGSSVDLVLMIFIFSALSPAQWWQAVRNIHAVLKPGGQVLFRDYGRGDLAQVRFKKGRYMDENFYVRGDGTRVYFFDRDQLACIWQGLDKSDDAAETNPSAEERGCVVSASPSSALFDVLDLGVDRRLLVNRQRKLKMYRCWLQGRFRKRLPTED